MANYDTNKSKDSTLKTHYTFISFNIPSTTESAAARIIKNLGKFSFYYVIFLWTILFISLVPNRNVSTVNLVSVAGVTFMYFRLLREISNSIVIHNRTEKRFLMFVLSFMLFLMFVMTAFELIVISAGIYLVLIVVTTMAVMLLHAVLSKTEDFFVDEECREFVPCVQEKADDSKTDNLV